MTDKINVTVCICTYQRPKGLRRLLTSLCEQVFKDVVTPVINIIVTDNECSEINRKICDHFSEQHQLSLVYLQENQQGISYARNTCLDNLPENSDFVAMIDDDEIAEPDWLNALLYAQEKTSADIVTGPTLPVFESNAPGWISHTGYFSKPHQPHRYHDLEQFPPTATCNVLMRATIFTAHGLRFDPVLALSGSEDKLLFQYLKLQGLQFIWAKKAVCHENIPPDRAHFNYMLAEALRRGSTRFYIKIKLKTSTKTQRYRLAVRSVFRSLLGIFKHSGCACLYSLSGKKRRHKAALNLLYTAENIGFLASVFGYKKNHY